MNDHHEPSIGLFPEWHPQLAVLIAWPDDQTDFSDLLDTIEQTYLQIVAAISRYQIVMIAVRDRLLKDHVNNLLSAEDINKQQIIYVEIPYDDIWVRDIAPLAVKRQQETWLLTFRFNAWGNQYPCQKDAEFARRFIATQVLSAPFLASDLVLEGGAFDSNGVGDVLTTAACLYDPARNRLEPAVIHQQLLNDLGPRRLMVLENGRLIGDDTGGHIDTLARFCSSNTIVYTHCEDRGDPHYHALEAMKSELERLRTSEHSLYQLVPLPLPSPIIDAQNQRLPANYANFLIINHAVLVPQYNVEEDAAAVSILKSCFPERMMIPINCLALIQQYGSLHCMTMNYPDTLKLSRDECAR